ncbi:MAG: class I SAM-dependent methyltransferase [Thermodesulfobacteriota bacterium]|nr:class I SAM-dependent methyltransferase [Thermodesulfobacteriota bacterium]
MRTADYFGTLDFTGKHMLEVGAGNGLYTCCVSVLGAARPVALEPELKGATDSAVSTFRRSLDRLYIQIVEFYQLSLQEFVSPDQSFDTIYLLASINHLNETHVQTLHCNKESRCLYQHLLQSLFNWLKSGGTLVISDSSRWHAFTPMIKLGLMHKHPFQPNIEWEKHQSPKVWKELLEEIGFTPVHFHWATNWRYRWMPRFLVDNIVAAHFYSSLFVLRAHRP